MGHSRGRKVKSQSQKTEGDIFWMSLEEAKEAISDKFDYLVERYEGRKSKKAA